MATSLATNIMLPGLERILTCPTLPSLPIVALKVLELTSKQNVALDEIAAVVQNDQALTSKILRTINSSFYGLSSPCPTISRAVALLGLSTVKSLVLSFSLVDMTRRSQVGLDLDAYWHCSVYTATVARKLAMRTGVCDPEEAFISGIMQNVAMLAMDVVIGETYRHIVACTGSDHNRLSSAEKELLGFDHAYVGAKLAEKWRLTQDQVDAIANHHQRNVTKQSFSPLARIAIAANEISLVLLVDDEAGARLAAERIAFELFSLGPDDVRTLLKESKEDGGALARQLLQGARNAPASEELLARAEEARLQHQLDLQREAERLRRAADELERRVVTDALTGVGNRALFDRELATHFSRVKGGVGSLGLILLDADCFKNVNDTFGHQAGDKVLTELASRFRTVVEAAGLVCRYGGEEFAVLMPNATEQAVAEAAERLRVAVADTPVALDGNMHGARSVAVTVSAGAVLIDGERAPIFSRAQMLTQAADRALYAAKHAGRNCVRVFRPRPPAADAQNEAA